REDVFERRAQRLARVENPFQPLLLLDPVVGDQQLLDRVIRDLVDVRCGDDFAVRIRAELAVESPTRLGLVRGAHRLLELVALAELHIVRVPRAPPHRDVLRLAGLCVLVGRLEKTAAAPIHARLPFLVVMISSGTVTPSASASRSSVANVGEICPISILCRCEKSSPALSASARIESSRSARSSLSRSRVISLHLPRKFPTAHSASVPHQ